jgi:2'-5' RNA ligase
LRSFIAIELSETAKSALAELQQELKKTGADVRWVKPENIHLTLKFLGNIEKNIIDSIVQILTGTCNKFEVFTLEIKGTGVFPSVKSPRVIWVSANGKTTVTGIQLEIETGLSSLGFEREKRTFTPHLTLGRFKTSQGKRPLLDKVELFKDNSYGVIDVRSISIMRSDLSPAGAKYTRIAEIPLRKTHT